MSDKDIIEEVRELLANATPGPWGVLPSNNSSLAHIETQEGTTAEQGQGFTVCSIPKKRINDASLIARAPELLRALADEVGHARLALKGMVELWDANNPDDPCGCVGASDDCKHPPPCELCVARLIMEGRTKELFEG